MDLPSPEPVHAHHFQDLEQQIAASRLAMWVFLASEVLLFSAMFALYAAYRIGYAAAFTAGIHENARLLGSLNTVLLICSSFSAALSVHAVREGRPRAAVGLLGLTLVLAAGFLAVKGIEWNGHFHHGIWPGGRGHFYLEHTARGLPVFFTLYYLMTGAHALHVVLGMAALAWLALEVALGRIHAVRYHPLELGTLYWHLVDIVWIFLWPLFYLTGGRP